MAKTSDQPNRPQIQFVYGELTDATDEIRQRELVARAM